MKRVINALISLVLLCGGWRVVACATSLATVAERIEHIFITWSASRSGDEPHPLTDLYREEMVACCNATMNLLNHFPDLGYVSNQRKWTPLHYAARDGCTFLVQIFQVYGSCGPSNDEERKPLHYAARSGHDEIIKLLIPRSSIDSADKQGRTALMLAARNGHDVVVELLLAAKAKVEPMDQDGWKCMHHAIMGRNISVVKRLALHSRHEINTPILSLETRPLHLAVLLDDVEMARVLLSHGASTERHDVFQMKPAHYAWMNGQNEMFQLLQPTDPVSTSLPEAFLSEETFASIIQAEKYFVDIRLTLLHYAVNWSLATMVAQLIQHGASPNWTDEHGRTPLHYAVDWSLATMVAQLIQHGASPNWTDEHGRTPLHRAADASNEAMMELLMQNGADPTVLDRREWTVLHVAAHRGNWSRLSMLLERHPLLDALTLDDQTLLLLATAGNHHTTVSGLLHAGANPNQPGEQGRTPLHVASLLGHCTVVEVLLVGGANSQLRDCTGATPLHLAAINDHLPVIKLLLKGPSSPLINASGEGWKDDATGSGSEDAATMSETFDVCAVPVTSIPIPVDVRDAQGQTPLHCAAYAGHFEVVRFLLDEGADPNLECTNGRGAFLYAAEGDHLDVARMLLPLTDKATLLAPDRHDRLFIHYAADRLPSAIINFLLSELPLDVNAVDSCDGWTPMHYAAVRGNVEVVDVLLQHGAVPNVRDAQERTPLHHAAISLATDVASALLNAGALLNQRDIYGRTPLHYAVINDCLPLVEKLLPFITDSPTLHLDIHAPDMDGWTPLHWAALNRNADIVAVLLQHKAPVDSKNALGWTPLHCAVLGSSWETLSEDDGIDIDHVSEDENNGDDDDSSCDSQWRIVPGEPSLYYNMPNIIGQLLFAGANPNIGDLTGSTLLHLLAQHGCRVSMEMALKCNGDPTMQNESGDTPLHVAVCSNQLYVVKLLVNCMLQRTEAGALDQQNKEGNTALHEAEARGQRKLSGFLRHHGSSTTLRNQAGLASFDMMLDPVSLISKDLLEYHQSCLERERKKSESGVATAAHRPASQL